MSVDRLVETGFVLFFGCNERPGHFLIGPYRSSIRDFEADKLNVPRDHNLDGTHIFLPRPEKEGTGALTYLPATDRTVLAWWGSPFDKRGGVNNAVIVSGRELTVERMWQRFDAVFPRLAAQLTMPSIVGASEERERIAALEKDRADSIECYQMLADKAASHARTIEALRAALKHIAEGGPYHSLDYAQDYAARALKERPNG